MSKRINKSVKELSDEINLMPDAVRIKGSSGSETISTTVATSKGLTLAEAKKVIRQNTQLTTELVKTANAQPMLSLNAVAQSSVQSSPSDIVDELEKGGPAFGSFVKSVGLAVAEAQAELDENLVKTAEKLSQTQIDVIGVFEQQLNDDGTMDKGVVHLQKLPLTNYVPLPAYYWKKVFLQADMDVSEFNSANGFNIKQKASSFGANLSASFSRRGGFGVSGGANFNSGSSETNVGASFSQDFAAGKLHLEGTLEPRADIELPTPFILQKGPRLKISVGAREDLDANGSPTGDPTQAVGRQVTLVATLTKKDGSSNPNQTLQVSVDQPSLNFIGSGKTDNNGELQITVSRTGAAFDKNSFISAVVRVSLNLVSDTVGITL